MLKWRLKHYKNKILIINENFNQGQVRGHMAVLEICGEHTPHLMWVSKNAPENIKQPKHNIPICIYKVLM